MNALIGLDHADLGISVHYANTSVACLATNLEAIGDVVGEALPF